jgi:hypothetical protein
VLARHEPPNAVALIAVGRLREVLQTYLDQVPPGPYTVVGVTNSEELADELAGGTVVGVLLGGGLDDEARADYRTQIEHSAPGLPIVDHVGGKDGFVSQLLGLLPADT